MLQDKGFALFHAFTLTTYIPVTISKSPVLSCPLSLVQHGLAPHYRQSKNWSHDRKSLPYKRPREYERLGRAVVSHSLSRTRLETVKATFVNFGFVIHSPSMGIESEDLGQSETFVLWEWVGWVTHVPPRDQNQLTEHTSLPELFRFGFAPQLFDCISNATCFLSSTRLVLFHHTLNNSLSKVCGTIGTNGTIVLYEKLIIEAPCTVANQVTGRRACFNIIDINNSTNREYWASSTSFRRGFVWRLCIGRGDQAWVATKARVATI